MKTFTQVPRALLGLLALQAGWHAFAGLQVEQVQRDFQARYHLVTGGYVQWPKCSAGQTPAPHFPKDGFYGDLTQEPDKGVEVVRDLVQNFYSNNVIYTSFVKAPNGFGDLEQVEEIPRYTEADMEPIILPSEVNTNNYLEMLQATAAQVAKLTFVTVPTAQVVSTDGSDSKICFTANTFTNGAPFTCAQAQSCTTNGFASTSWGSIVYRLFTDDCQVEWEWPVDDYSPGPYRAIASTFECIAIADEWDGYFGAEARNTRGKIAADFTNIKAGTAKVFLKLTSIPSYATFWSYYSPYYPCDTVFGQARPTDAPAGTYGCWADGVLTPGRVPMTDFVTQRTIGLGLDADLVNLRGTGAITYKGGGWQQAGLTTVDWGRAVMDESWFKMSFNEAAQNASAIRFDLSSFVIGDPRSNLTAWELNSVLNNPSLLAKTTFIWNNVEVSWDGTRFVRP